MDIRPTLTIPEAWPAYLVRLHGDFIDSDFTVTQQELPQPDHELMMISPSLDYNFIKYLNHHDLIIISPCRHHSIVFIGPRLTIKSPWPQYISV